MTRAIIETKRIDGKPAYRLEGTPQGAWIVAASEIDAMLDRVQSELGVKRGELLQAIHVQSSCVSRCRKQYGVPDHWIQCLTEYSGIPMAELCQVACMDHAVRTIVQPVVQPHLKERRAA